VPASRWISIAGLLARFEAKFIPEPNSGCWLWTAFINETNGYGYIMHPTRNSSRAHTVAWELYRGSRKGLCVLHHCDNRACVNPDHLYLGTYQDNANDRDRRQRRRAPKGTLNGRAKLTENDVKAIRVDPRPRAQIAAEYGVKMTAIESVIGRRSWKHIP
jgi:HNH endonuclease